MTLPDYRTTNEARFPDNDRFQIEAKDLRDFAADTADLFGPQVEPLKAAELAPDKQGYATLSPRAALLLLLNGGSITPPTTPVITPGPTTSTPAITVLTTTAY